MGTAGDDPAALENGEDRLARFCLEKAAVSVFRLDENGRILYANQNACESLGYLRYELLGMTVYDIDIMVTPETWPGAWQRIRSELSVTVEGAHRRKDGTTFPVEVTASYLEFEGRRYSVALIKDITERKRISESLRLAQFMFEKASFAIFLIRRDGRIANINEHACQYLGYTRDELLGMNIFDIDHVYSLDDVDFLVERLREKGNDHFETVHRCKDGKLTPVAVTSNLIEFNENQYSVTFVQDITERKNAEKQHLKMEAHMRQAQKMESLGTLAGGIAHDFNNILAAILGYAELAQLQDSEDNQLNQYLSQISQAGLRAKDLVNQILTFSRQGHSAKEPLDISRAIGEALKLLKATLPADIEIRENIAPNLAPIFADESQIHRIIMNLCTNAYHAMKSTGGLLDVSLTAVAIHDQDAHRFQGIAPGHYLKLSIADTGCGIAPDMLNRIFDPYYTTKPSGEGTGLGLATVHGIVKDHGGVIKVYSEVGVGTTFHVLLPIAEALVETVADQAKQLPGGSERILLVDDETFLVDLGRDLLERLGYRVETKVSSIDAIEDFQADPQKYDLVISDITMPKMTGDVMARQMKRIRPDIPIILCSGFSERIHAQETKALGISAMLMKPVTYEDLAQSVRRALETE